MSIKIVLIWTTLNWQHINPHGQLTKPAKQLHSQRREDEKEQEEEQTEVAHLRQSLDHCVQECTDSFCHLKELQY